MVRMIFSVQAKASKQAVWEMLWDDKTYRIWTSVFSEGSHVETDWEEGSRILFLDGNGNGMYSLIEKHTPCEFMSFKHLGDIKDMNKEGNQSEWSGSTESYTLTEVNGFTRLVVEVDVEDEYQDFFRQQFPLALEKVKELVEEKKV